MTSGRYGRVSIKGVLLILLAIIVACGGSATATPVPTTTDSQTSVPVPTATQAPEPAADLTPKKGGVLIMVPASDLSQKDPINSGIIPDGMHGDMVLTRLFNYDADVIPQPELVDKFSVSSDGLTYNFTLRDGIKFSDGRPVTSEEAVLSMKRFLSGRNALAKLLNADVVDVQADGPLEITLTLNRVNSMVLETLAERQANIYVKEDAVRDFTTPGDVEIGAGVMLFVEWKPGASARYEPNPDYVQRSEPNSEYAGAKPIYIDELQYFIIPERATRAVALEAGQVDYIDFPLQDDFESLNANPDIVIAKEQITAQNWIFFNKLIPPFDDVIARRAVMVGLDQETLLRAAYAEGFWSVCGSLIPCGSIYESTAGNFGDAEQGDEARAKDLWAQTGYDGSPIAVRTFADRPNMLGMGLVVKQFLEDGLDATVEFKVAEIAGTFNRLLDRDQALQGDWNISMIWAWPVPATAPLTHFCLRAYGQGWVESKRINELKVQFTGTLGLEDRKAIMDEIQEAFYDEVGCYIAGVNVDFKAHHKDVKGVTLTHSAQPPVFWNLWLDR